MATSVPVVTVTSRAPTAAFATMLTFTVMLVAVTDVGAVTVMAVPLKFTTDALLKWVKEPVMVMGRFCCPAVRCWD